MGEREDLGQFVAVDMHNGYTYIGYAKHATNKPLMLKNQGVIETALLAENYGEVARDIHKLRGIEKEVRLDNPGPIHFLEE